MCKNVYNATSESASSVASKTRDFQSSELPDLAWIRNHVPVLEVGRELGLPMKGNWTHCWRPENHAHGDANPSLRFYVRGNRVRCFVCDMVGGHSNIDLVMGVLGVDFMRAVFWIAERFPVPETRPGRPIGARSKQPGQYHVGVSGSEIEVLIRSGLFGQLTPAERSILLVLHTLRDLETGLTRLSYSAIMRYAGVGSRGNVSKALRHLERIHAIVTIRAPRFGITRDANLYRVTLDNEKLQNLCAETYRSARPEVERERALRRELRTAREKKASERGYARTSPFPGLATEKEGLHPPAPPAPHVSPEIENLNPDPRLLTYEGLDLSSPGEPQPNSSVPIGNQEIAKPSGRGASRSKR